MANVLELQTLPVDATDSSIPTIDTIFSEFSFSCCG